MPQPLPFLCSTLHDEHGGLSWLVERHLPTLLKQVSGLCVSATPKTSSALIEQLRKHGCSVYQLKHDRFAAAYKHIFQLAKRFSKNQTILCCDLDRVLHWMETYPAEWKRMLKTAIQQEYLILERTERAYRTHHEALYHTEPFANAITSRALGEKKRRDYLTSGMSFSPKVFKRLVASFSKLSPDVRILCQIPLVLQSQGIRPTYRAYEGLEWETPDRFVAEVKAAGGLEAWRTNASSPAEWKHRNWMSLTLCQPALNVIASLLQQKVRRHSK